MSEIVERLREGCGCNYPETTCMAEDECRDAFEAADTIIRLTAEVEQNAIDLEEYRRDVEKLRAALNADPQTLRLHLGEMSAQEMRTLRAGFQWALASAALK